MGLFSHCIASNQESQCCSVDQYVSYKKTTHSRLYYISVHHGVFVLAISLSGAMEHSLASTTASTSQLFVKLYYIVYLHRCE